jgi:hypothetical protein
MFIRMVDESLELMLRTQVPFPAEAGDVSFDVPSSTWSNGLTRPTINLFLFDITRSAQPNRAVLQRTDEGTGKAQRRVPQPMIELNYMVSAWVGGDAVESHQLLGEIISRVAGLDQVPVEFLMAEQESSIMLSFVEDDRHRARDIWNGANNSLQAGFSMHCTVAADTFGWTPTPAAVTAIEGGISRGTNA